MLYKNHRARCSNNGIKYSIQLMTLLTEMIPETTGVKLRLNTKRPHIKNKQKTINRTKIKKKTNSTKAIIFIYDRFTYKALKWYKQHVRSIHDCPILQDSHF
jgi:hypothetical protein